MDVQVVSAADLSQEQLAAWDVLQQNDPAAKHPFFRPEFAHLTGLECPDCRVAVVMHRGEYVAFFPFQLESPGIGRAIALEMTDIDGIISLPGTHFDLRQLIRKAGLKVWSFEHLPLDQTIFRRYVHCTADTYQMDVSMGYDEYIAGLGESGSSFFRQASRKSRKLIREVGPLRFEFHTSDEQVLDKLLEWKSAQLRARGCADTFVLPWVAGMLRRITKHQSEHFAGVLSALYAGEELVAVHMGLRGGAELCSWVPAHNADFDKYSPGVLIYLELAKSAEAEGIQNIDLGRGENRMKVSLSNHIVPVAIGSVELRPWQRVRNLVWHKTRSFAHNSPLFKAPLKLYRRLRTVGNNG